MVRVQSYTTSKGIYHKSLTIVAGLLLFCGLAVPAYAMCDAEPWTGVEPVTPKLAVEKSKEKTDEFAFFGQVEVADIVKSPDGQTRYDLKVLNQYEGKSVEGFPVYSAYEGDCAFLAKKGDVHVVNIPAAASKPYMIGVPHMYYYGVSEDEIASYMDAKLF